ncbi:MAG: DNA polymerase III subunit beta [Planctomycetota bacterium]
MGAMKVVCDRADLLDAINLASGAVASRSPKHQLECVKLVAHADGELTIAATDGEIALRLTLPRVDVQSAGESLVRADKLRAIIGAEDREKTLALETDGDALHVRGEDARFILHGYPPEDFPPVPDFRSAVAGGAGEAPAKDTFEHPAGDLSDLVQRTLFAAARENSRYAINGVLLKREGKKLEMVATDGRRLALSRATLGSAGNAEAPTSCIIPSKALSMLVKLLNDDTESVDVAILDNKAVFDIGPGDDGTSRATLSTNLVEGAFPPYEDVIPKDQDIKVRFDRDTLASAVKRAALLTNEESRGVRLAFSGGEKTLNLSSRAPEMGEAEVRVELSGYEGDDIEIGFNPVFITDALKVIDDSEVLLELKASGKPGLVRSGQDFLYVVMPVNLT